MRTFHCILKQYSLAWEVRRTKMYCKSHKNDYSSIDFHRDVGNSESDAKLYQLPTDRIVKAEECPYKSMCTTVLNMR